MNMTLSKTMGLCALALVAACGEPEPSDNLDPILKGQIEDALARFEADPSAFMNALPEKSGRTQPGILCGSREEPCLYHRQERAPQGWPR